MFSLLLDRIRISFEKIKQKELPLISWKRKLLVQLHRLNYLYTLIKDQGVLLREVEQKLRNGRLKKTLPKLICAFGCLIHIAGSLNYFRYPIILDTIHKLDIETSYTLTVCIDPYEFFATEEEMSRGLKLKPLDFRMFQSKLLNRSNAEMFEKTPDERKNIIVLCRVWGGVNEHRKVNDLSQPVDRLMLMETNGTRCHKYFRVKKSFIQSKICYSFTPTVKLDWNRHQLANAFHPGMTGYFYIVALNSSLISKKFSVLATTPTDPFSYSSIWSSYVLGDYNFSRWHVVSYTKYIQQVLPPPYSDGGFTHMMHMKCIDLCINKQLGPFNQSLTSIFHRPSAQRLITFADRVGNDAFNDWLNDRFDQCEQECKYLELKNFESEIEFTVTDITKGRPSQSSTFRGLNRLLTSFYLRRSDHPVVVVIFKAQISFFEFLIIMGSIISIWFGLSFKGIPKSLLKRSARSAGEIFHELRLKIDSLRRFIRQI